MLKLEIKGVVTLTKDDVLIAIQQYVEKELKVKVEKENIDFDISINPTENDPDVVFGELESISVFVEEKDLTLNKETLKKVEPKKPAVKK
jgi:hypothetical protein